jgi:hypothetical protein
MTLLLLGVAMPWSTYAKTERPQCTLSVGTTFGTTTIAAKGEVYFPKGSAVQLNLTTKNATRVTNAQGQKEELTVSKEVSPKKTTSFTYRVQNGSDRTTCEVILRPMTGSITLPSSRDPAKKLLLKGEVTGEKSVRVVVQKVGSSKPEYTSGTTKVSRGMWKVTVPKKLSSGTYNVKLVGTKHVDQDIIATTTLRVGKGKETQTSNTTQKTTLAVSSIPLLAGGVARPGTTVPVAYLQMTNVGKETLTLTGIGVTARGTAPTALFSTLSTVDGTGSIRSMTDASKSGKLFTNGKSMVPVSSITFAPGQMRLFTVKVALSETAASTPGTTIIMDVNSLETNASVRATLPIRGATWVIR